MRADCPSCEATYDIPDHLLVAGRKVRCARCGNAWAPVAAPKADDTLPDGAHPDGANPDNANPDNANRGGTPADGGDPRSAVRGAHASAGGTDASQRDDGTAGSALAMAMPPEHNAMDQLASHAVAPPPPSAGLKAAWAASVAAIVVLAVGAVIWRDDIARIWPPSAWILAPLGITAEARPPTK